MGYWIDAEENPFNNMSWTRGGGGYNNPQTHESNERRALTMSGSGVDALPRYATPGVGSALVDRGDRYVVGDMLYQNGNVPTSGPGNAEVRTAAPGQGGTGPGVAAAATGPSGGSRSGSKLVIGGADGVFWDKAPSIGPTPGSFVRTSALPALAPVLKGENTALMLGSEAFVPHPGTSNAEEIEALMGEGDSPLEPAWYAKWYANTWHLSHNLSRWANDPATKQWAKDFDQTVLDVVTPWD